MGSKEVFALRKQNKSVEALALARNEYLSNNGDIWLIRAYAWCLYDHVKPIIENFESGRISGFELSNRLSPYMREFATIGNPLRGDTCFTQFLNMANKASKGWDEFLDFAQWVGIDGFSEDDKKPYITESGDKLDSLQTRFIRAIVRETSSRATNKVIRDDLLEWGVAVAKIALEINPNDQWLHFYQSKLYLLNNEVELAIKNLMPVMHRQRKAPWAWALLGSILERNQQIDESLICYMHATQVAREEQEVARIRIILAKKLYEKNRYAEAGFQVSKALEYRQKNNFNIPDDLHKLQIGNWYKDLARNNGIKESPDVEKQAQEILFNLDKDNITYKKAVIDHHNKQKEMTYVLTSIDEGLSMYYGKFPELERLEIGTVIEVAYSKINPKKPLSYKVLENEEVAGLCRIFTGELKKLSHKNFAFIKSEGESIFVPPFFADSYESDVSYRVQCRAMKKKDRQGKIGWRVVLISNLE